MSQRVAELAVRRSPGINSRFNDRAAGPARSVEGKKVKQIPNGALVSFERGGGADRSHIFQASMIRNRATVRTEGAVQRWMDGAIRTRLGPGK